MKKDWGLTQETFELLLNWLDSDRDKAAEKYEKVQSRLIRIFACHGSSDPEKLADETIDRVVSKIDWLVEKYVGDPTLYFCGVARNVLKEDLRERASARVLPPVAEITEVNESGLYDCLDKCMEELPQHGRRLVLSYYDYEEEGHVKIARRSKMAEELGITLRALRLRVYHTRLQLRACIEICLRQNPVN